MFAMLSNFWAALAALFDGFRIFAESGRDVAILARVHTINMVKEAATEAGDMTATIQYLETSGIATLVQRPTKVKTLAKA